jgi:uncharacterized protein YbjT (DUF2867 family)
MLCHLHRRGPIFSRNVVTMTCTLLVTGATGTLGRELLPVALAAGHRVRAVSRRDHRNDDVRWQRCDLLTGTGLDEAVDGVDVILHCATQPTGDKDLTSTQNLLAAARGAAVSHVVYISIVGVDRIPLPYYKTKLRVEQMLVASDVDHTVLRATQFHDLIALTFRAQRLSPVLFAVRGVSFQPIDTRDVAKRLVELAAAEPTKRAPDIGGPQISSHADLGRAYLAQRGSRRRVVALPVPGKIAAGYRAGAHLAPQNPVGSVRFEDYLRLRDGSLGSGKEKS